MKVKVSCQTEATVPDSHMHLPYVRTQAKGLTNIGLVKLITIVGDRYCHYPYLADEETEAQRLNYSSKVTHKD